MTDPEHPLSNTIKMVWATSIVHLIYTQPNVVLNAPPSFAPYIDGLAFLLFAMAYGIAFFITFLIAKGIARDQDWARFTFIVLILFSLPTRISSLFYSNSMFNDQAKFRISFFLILAWCIFDVILIYILSFLDRTKD